MLVIVKGDQIRLLDLSMIRRYGTPTPIVDPAVAKILVNKGLAIYSDKKIEDDIPVKITKLVGEVEDVNIFPKTIIN